MIRCLSISIATLMIIGGCRNKEPSIKPVKIEPVSIGAFGTLVPVGQFRNLSPKPPAGDFLSVVDQLFVTEGETVQRGKIMATFINHEYYKTERKSLERIIMNYERQLKESNGVLARFQSLLNSGAYPIVSYHERLILHEGILARYSDAKVRLAANQRNIANSVLVAPIDGVVTRIYSRPGEAVTKDGVIQIGDLNSLIAQVEVYESDFGKVKVGQRCVVRSDGGSFDGMIQGKVTDVIPGIRQRTTLPTTAVPTVDVRVGLVKISLDKNELSRLHRLAGTKVVVKIYL